MPSPSATLATMPPVSVQAPPELYELLAKDAATMERVNGAYAKAKDRLFDLTTERRRCETPDCVHEIRSLLHFIEACNRCSADSWNAPWYKEKTAKVKSAFEDLIRRKNANHPGYELSAEQARTLYSFHAPYAYRETPPSPHQIEEFLK